MRKGLGIGLTMTLLVAAGAVRADEQADARKIIDKAIKAAGGAEKLAPFLDKSKATSWKEKGMYYGMGDGLPYTGSHLMQYPDQLRMEVDGIFVIVINGDKGWVRANGETKEMSKEQLAEQKESHHSGWVAGLLPLIKGNTYQYALLGESKIGDRPAVGVRVSHKGHRDVKLFIDKENSLVLKSEFPVKAEEMDEKEVNQECLYSNYKDVEGLKFPTKMQIKRDGKRFVESEMTEVKVVGKLDNSTFAKP